MAKFISLFEIEVPADQQAELEQMFREEMAKYNHMFEGWQFSLLKGSRGDRQGKYAVRIDVDSVESRDRYYPQHNVASEETNLLVAQYPEIFAKWDKLIFSHLVEQTEYEVIVEVERQTIQ